MFDFKKILGVIPARGGSKGVPGKNIRLVGGKPLIAWIIDAAKKSRYIDRLIVSSDDREIIDVALSYGCEAPFVRPSELAEDESTTASAIKHAISSISGYDYVVTLQPTTPLTQAIDIDLCIQKCIQANTDACVSVVAADKSPYWMFRLGANSVLDPVMGKERLKKRRQDLPRIYTPNGAVYVTKCEFVRKKDTLYADKTLGHVMPKERSIDIDTEIDFLVLETLLAKERNDG